MTIPAKARKWADAMSKTARGRRIIKNVEREQNVPSGLARSFFNAISRAYAKGGDPMRAMGKALLSTAAFVLAGPSFDLGLDLLTRFEPLARLADSPDLKRAGVSLQRLIANPGLVDIITELRLGNARGIVWTALEEAVSADVNRDASIREVVDRLGITDDLREDMYEVVYGAGDVGDPCHVPTVLDAGADDRFRPSPKGAKHGMTHPCSGSGAGYPEYVHRECVVGDPNVRLHQVGAL